MPTNKPLLGILDAAKNIGSLLLGNNQQTQQQSQAANTMWSGYQPQTAVKNPYAVPQGALPGAVTYQEQFPDKTKLGFGVDVGWNREDGNWATDIGPANNTAPWVSALYGPGAMAGIQGVPTINPNIIPGYQAPMPQWLADLLLGLSGPSSTVKTPPSGTPKTTGGGQQLPTVNNIYYGGGGGYDYTPYQYTPAGSKGPLINWTI